MKIVRLFFISLMFFNIKNAWACSVCFGNAGSKTSQGTFAAMYFLLALILFVLGGIASTAFYWANRAKNFETQNLEKSS